MPPDADSTMATGAGEPTVAPPDIASKATARKEHEPQVEQPQRPYPWNLVSDSTHMAVGSTLLLLIFFPALSLIILSTASGEGMYYFLYKKNPPCRYILETLRSIQRCVFRQIGNLILLDPRDYSYLPWMFWGIVSCPTMFYWACSRYTTHGFEISTFLIYHLIRLGPRYRFFAHHETLIHTEGHATGKSGLYRNPFYFKARQPLPKIVRQYFTDHINSAIIGPFYGSIPNSYSVAHNKIHHRWHNDTGDVHTNMDVDRTVLSSFILWLPRFVAYWTGLSPALLFWKRGEYGLLRQLLHGMLYYYALSALVWYYTDTLFYWAYWLYPHLEAASFLGGIAYMWHAFSEESDPSNQYVNSMTILRGHDNIWNEDFHVVHHHEPYTHWTEMPDSFVKQKLKYVECRATVFADCEQGVFFAWMFGAKWDDMADHFVDLQYVFANGDKNSDLLLNVKEVAEVERERFSRRDENDDDDDEKKEVLEADIARHHADVKELLLRRLRYHYLGTREEEWSSYSVKLNEGARDFGKGSIEKQS